MRHVPEFCQKAKLSTTHFYGKFADRPIGLTGKIDIITLNGYELSESSESICRSSLLHRATNCWLDVCMSWRAKTFRISRRGSRGVGPRICCRLDRTHRRTSDCIWIVDPHRGVFRERRNGSGLFHVLRGNRAHGGGEVFPNHERRRAGPGVLLGFLFHYLLRPGALEYRCDLVQTQEQCAIP